MTSPFHERATLRYLKWIPLYEKEKPFQIFVPLPPDVEDDRTDNLVFESETEQEILDVRGQEHTFTLNRNGFEYVHHETKIDVFDTKEKVEEIYLTELAELLKTQLEDVDRVVFFNWRIRKNDVSTDEGEMINLGDPMQHLLPITQVHIDTSPYSVGQRVRTQFPDECESLLKRRIRIINVWRPINKPIEDWPLAVCDGSTLEKSDLIRCDHIRPQEQAETTFILRNQSQKWYYLNKQNRNEVLMLKNFDSDPSVQANCCPHTSFEHRYIRPQAPMRESIEARALVFSTLPEEWASTQEVKVEGLAEKKSAALIAEIREDPAMMLC